MTYETWRAKPASEAARRRYAARMAVRDDMAAQIALRAAEDEVIIGPVCEAADWLDMCGHQSCYAIQEGLTADELRFDAWHSQAARDAAETGYGGARQRRGYAAYLDRQAAELAAKFPDREEYFMTRSLSEALAGNDGD
jgi:hypothetical protein